MNKEVIVVGAGIAGSLCAYELSKRGIKVKLYEMKKQRKLEAHKIEGFSELVCSNSLRGASLDNGAGLLKEELRILQTLFMEAADYTKVPAGGSLSVNRQEFSDYITEKINGEENIEVIHDEFTEIPLDKIVVLAPGPLLDGELFKNLKNILGDDFLYFFDGAAPIVSGDSVNLEKAFFKARYNKGEATDYLNCPFTKEEYEKFYDFLIKGEKVIPHLKEEEKERYFEGCMPIEEMARRGHKTLLFGPLKPVGLEDPITDKRYHGVLQLRRENKEGTMYNLVGCQSGLKFGDQKKLLELVPGLENAEILRYGVIHRNSYINAKEVLDKRGHLRKYPNIFIAGQLSGVEGYVESAASGFVCAINAYLQATQKEEIVFPRETMIGSLMEYISSGDNAKYFQPMNGNFGLLPPLEEKIRDKKEKRMKMANIAIEKIKELEKVLNEI